MQLRTLLLGLSTGLAIVAVSAPAAAMTLVTSTVAVQYLHKYDCVAVNAGAGSQDVTISIVDAGSGANIAGGFQQSVGAGQSANVPLFGIYPPPQHIYCRVESVSADAGLRASLRRMTYGGAIVETSDAMPAGSAQDPAVPIGIAEGMQNVTCPTLSVAFTVPPSFKLIIEDASGSAVSAANPSANDPNNRGAVLIQGEADGFLVMRSTVASGRELPFYGGRPLKMQVPPGGVVYMIVAGCVSPINATLDFVGRLVPVAP